MKKATREWVRKAEADYQLAILIARKGDPFHDQRCFHCQQSAEKYLKALLEELDRAVRKSHELERLLTVLQPHYPLLRLQRRGLAFLSNFAIGVRYPGDNATKRQADAALRWAGHVREACRTLLGLRPPRRRGRKSP
jgi:HEPN domain-containing protein